MASVTVLVRNERTGNEKEVIIQGGCSKKYAFAKARIESGFPASDPVKIISWERNGKVKRHRGTKPSRILTGRSREWERGERRVVPKTWLW